MAHDCGAVVVLSNEEASKHCGLRVGLLCFYLICCYIVVLFVPGGRYLYYAGRTAKFYNNCYLLRAEEDTREEWSNVTWRAMSCLMTGGGIGIDYSRLRASGKPRARTGGTASGPIPLMYAINEIGRNVMQGGSRRSAIYASLNWQHEDIPLFLRAKNWSPEVKELKNKDFNFPATLDMTNISVNYDDAWGFDPTNPVFLQNVRQAMETGDHYFYLTHWFPGTLS